MRWKAYLLAKQNVRQTLKKSWDRLTREALHEQIVRNAIWCTYQKILLLTVAARGGNGQGATNFYLWVNMWYVYAGYD